MKFHSADEVGIIHHEYLVGSKHEEWVVYILLRLEKVDVFRTPVENDKSQSFYLSPEIANLSNMQLSIFYSYIGNHTSLQFARSLV